MNADSHPANLLIIPAVIGLLGVFSAGPAPVTPGPQLSIAIDNGRTSTAAGDSLTYTIDIRNLGTTEVSQLGVTQSVPAGLTFESADSAGSAAAEVVTWRIDLKPSATATVHSTMTVGATPADLLRLATVACARMSSDDPPIVCAAHSDQLPAGAAAAARAQSRTAASPSWTDSGKWYLVGGIAVLVVVLAILWIRRRITSRVE